ncbi:TfoX/Sxy family protein [Pseudaminobacter sp. 19-2017]|uniref:TfoX/Sxy family protein n=1 Tax=Pseudaminobacter soli (ex Zhang et al. 2022) TaxID=2831468 RepID=A0A942I8C0_9HYPH|nr:TfoX/Sxy family protein [Pseudaminobacter soli]MBS3649205.1 TfoX/Sxy family protein [Pseudaminobacter soli]
MPNSTLHPLASLPNLGPRTAWFLDEIGVATEADLRRLGAVDAYRRLKFQFGRQISLNALYALAGAIENRDWRSFNEEEKAQLRAKVEG